MGDARIGQKCLMPGYGFGGPCFPRDNRALGGYARALGVEPLIPDATDRYNEIHSTNIAKLILGEVSGEAQGSARAMKSSSHLYAAGQKALQSQDRPRTASWTLSRSAWSSRTCATSQSAPCPSSRRARS